MNATKSRKVIRVSNAAAAAQTAVTSSAVDMKGWRSCEFIVLFGSITTGGVQSVKAQQCDTSGGSYADLAGTSISVADDQDNKVVRLEINEPRERFLKCVVSRGTEDSVVDGILAILSEPIAEPITDDDTVAGAELHHAPAEGTA